MAGSVISQPNARNFNEIIKAVGILEESNSALELRLKKEEKENQLLKEKIDSIKDDLKFLQNGVKKYYENISKDIKTLSEEIGEVSKAVDLVGSNQKNHDAMNFDIMKKMLMAQESMFSNTIALLEAHSIIDKADDAVKSISHFNGFDDTALTVPTAVSSIADCQNKSSRKKKTQRNVKIDTPSFDSLVSDLKSDLDLGGHSMYKSAIPVEDDKGITEPSKYLLKLTVLQFMRENYPHDISNIDKVEEKVNEIAKSNFKYGEFLDDLSQDPQKALKKWGFTAYNKL